VLVSTRLLRHADREVTAWANGGGVTREVARSGGDGPDFAWRVSVAEVDRPGPFSRLPGVDRVIVLLDGTGLVLSVDGRQHPLEPLRPFAFSGDATTTCELRDGPTRDLNVMTGRGRASATVQVLPVAGRFEARAQEDDDLLVMAVTDGVVATGPPALEMGRLDAVVGPVAVEGDGVVIVVRLARTEAGGA
jgi:environmental stress-induced protein Ves